jgi:SAM-dependent methyltransferase
MTPEDFRAALDRVPLQDRDAWLDHVLGIEGIPADGDCLPAGCVPYLPCSVDAVLRIVDQAKITNRDVFVDVGSGLGRAAMLTHLLTGATVIGLEIQHHLVRAARELAVRSNLDLKKVSFALGDAAELVGELATGSVFFLYCPFGGARLDRVLGALESFARTRPIRVATVDLPVPPRSWLEPAGPAGGDVAVYRCVETPTVTKTASDPA